MVMNEIDRLKGKDRVLNFVYGNISMEAGGSLWQPPFDRARTGSSKAPALVSAFDDEVSKSWTSEEIIGPSTDLRRIMIGLRVVAQTDSPVLIVGNTGTCKEVIARSVHALSHHPDIPFIHVNCQLARPEQILAALTEPAAESGFGGHAVGRTVFLEGVSSLSSTAQLAIVKALHLEAGGTQESSTSGAERVRLIASSDFNLLDAARMGSFSSALYQHLKTQLIAIPALRDRIEDLPMLIQRFLEQHSRQHGRPYRSLSANALELLQLYPWPGNLRELWQVMVRFVALREAGQLWDRDKHAPVDKPSLCQHPEAVPEWMDVDESDLMVTSLLQTISLRSRFPWLSLDE
jgi:DNA-binding NtrC family response regulator